MLFDQHLHSWHSFDCKTDPADNVQTALTKNLAGLTFTEHFDTHPSEWDACTYDDVRIEADLAALRDLHGEQIVIGKGIEVCYQPERMGFILDFLGAHHFDLIIVSVHWMFGEPVHEMHRFEALGPHGYLRRYLEQVRDATDHLATLQRDGHQPFHVLGHLDFAKRYAFKHWHFDEPLQEPALLDAILGNCLAAGIIPEINTSTLRNQCSTPMPGPETLARYAALGGTAVSLGSDAHSPQCVGQDFDRAAAMARAAGIEQLAVFRDGALNTVPLP